MEDDSNHSESSSILIEHRCRGGVDHWEREREREREICEKEREREKKEEGIPKTLDTLILGHLYFNLHNRGEQVATREEAMIQSLDARGSGMVLQFIFLKFENM